MAVDYSGVPTRDLRIVLEFLLGLSSLNDVQTVALLAIRREIDKRIAGKR